MSEQICPKCHKLVGAAESAAFCPFCGEKLRTGLDLSAVIAEPNPVKKHDRLLALQSEHPDSLEIAEELLHLGRLYERGKRGVDFTIIKCFVLNVYLEPETLRKDQCEALRREIFSHPDLDRCLKLADDPDGFLRRYLTRLSEEFIRLFLKGSTRYMHVILGFSNEGKAPKYLASYAALILSNMRGDDSLTGAQRNMLMRAFYDAFARLMNGETQYLDELLKKNSLVIETE
jgi:endogenous inhibitor of DNA gyrase (YacG/DUF329 family)